MSGVRVGGRTAPVRFGPPLRAFGATAARVRSVDEIMA